MHRNKVKHIIYCIFSEITRQIKQRNVPECRIEYLRVLLDVYKNITTETVKTKRDIYYNSPDLFKEQRDLDAIVAELANAMSVPRDALNIVASSKGLVYGAVSINGAEANLAKLIPSPSEIDSIVIAGRFVLVVEKDAVMNTLIQHYQTLGDKLGPFVLVTGKGFPCLKTKQFMNRLQSYNLPIFGLFDHDPYGLHISLNYVTSSPNEQDGCDCMQYLGLKRDDVDKYADQNKLSVLSESDEKKIYKLFDLAKSLKRKEEESELRMMRNLRQKAEIESLNDHLIPFLVDKLSRHLEVLE